MIPTPDDFKARMESIRDEFKDEPDAAHSRMDKLMYETLWFLGYHEGIKIYKDQEKWYS